MSERESKRKGRSTYCRERAAQIRAQAEAMSNSGLRRTMLEVAETWERLALNDEKTVIPPVSDDRPRHFVGFSVPDGRIETPRALAAVARAVAGALSDPEIREMVLRDAEVWDRLADIEEYAARFPREAGEALQAAK